ncbi:MAG TPA: MAPEG family protein [Caulobacteraceae bacterium]|nr:MAPEG family protein [Caulobacteraceae bacterium]
MRAKDRFSVDFHASRRAAGSANPKTEKSPMTIAEACLFAAVLIYLLTLAPAKVGGHREYDNGDPRNPDFYKDPLRARVLGAHQNGIETFPLFAAAVLLAEFRAAPQAWVDMLGASFILIRLAYVLAYLGDKSTLRSILWGLGFAINTVLFFLPAFKR